MSLVGAKLTPRPSPPAMALTRGFARVHGPLVDLAGGATPCINTPCAKMLRQS
jgi:hypothetical protein